MKRHLCGVHAVREALASHARDLAVIYLVDDSPRGPHAELATLARNARVSVEVRSAAELDALAGPVRHQGIVAVAAGDYPYIDLDALLSKARKRGPSPLIVALDEVTDPHNLGAIVRSVVALGADGVITLKDRAAPVTPVVVRASAGATEHAAIARVVNLSRALETLSRADVRTVGLDAEGTADLEAVDLTGPIALVVGSEGSGLRRLVRERCDVLARIPLGGPVASLNASVAAAIAIYEVTRQRRAAALTPR
ncbi:MAG: 23S rRNA (guanosine(2251)-2'-O)-methyltransferase RlmB [Polyangiales bacterium]